MNADVLQIGWAREDSAHDVLVKTLARRVAVEAFHWLDLETIDCQWDWSGPNPELEPKLSGKVFGADGKRIRFHGHINGEPLAPEAGMYRVNLTAFKLRKPRPSLVIIAHDGDRRSEDRRRGFEQVIKGLEWPFEVILAMPEPESEAWFICGFEPRDSVEAAALEQLAASLSFDPRTSPGRLTAKRDDVPTSAKRVIDHLTGYDVDRRNACLDHPLDDLVERGQGEVGLARFIADLRTHLPRLLGHVRTG